MNYFNLKKNIDNFQYVLFNILSDLRFNIKINTRNYIQKNVKYKNIHDKDRCFIIGTGPSLKNLTENEIQKLQNEKIFAVNSFFKIKEFKNLIPDYYMLIDDVFWRNTWVFSIDDIQNHYKGHSKFNIITDYRAKENFDFKNCIYLYCKKYPTNSINPNISKNMHVGINVISYAIMTAIYMGFKEIYLLGCDYSSFATREDEHYYDDDDEKYEITDRLGMLLSFFARATEIHYLIRDYCKKNDIKIYNSTSNSLLDAYPFKNIEEVLKVK